MKILAIAEAWPERGGGLVATRRVLKLLRRKFQILALVGERGLLEEVKEVYEPLLSRGEKPVLWLNAIKLARRREFRKLLSESDVLYIPRFAYPLIPVAKALGKRVVVHLHGYTPISYSAVVMAPYEKRRGRNIRDDIALECRKGLMHCAAALSLWWLPRIARIWLAQADRILCVSKRQAEIISTAAPELGNKIEVVYNPPPPTWTKTRKRKSPTFLYVGGRSYIKGYHIVKLLMKRINANFVLTKIERNVLTKSRVVKLGEVPDRLMDRLYGEAWALLFPSLWEEPFGYAVLEAMLRGTIPLAFNVGGVGEIVEGTRAEKFLVQPFDLEKYLELAEEIANMMPGELEDLSSALSSEASSKFNTVEIEKRLIDIIHG